MFPSFFHSTHGLDLGGLLSSFVHGFSWSVGWMLARSLGLPLALAALAVLAVVFLLRRSRRSAGDRR